MRIFAIAACLFSSSVFADVIVGFSAYENGDYTTAYPHLVQAAGEGNAEAMYLIGRMYQYGYGVNTDPAKAYEWYQKAAAKNNPLAQLSIVLFQHSFWCHSPSCIGKQD